MKPRSPPACLICSPAESVKKYEAVGRVGRLFPGKSGIDDKLVLTKPLTKFPEGHPREGQVLEYICSKCAWCRANQEAAEDGVTVMWYQSCAKCGERHVTTEKGKCASCDLGLL